MGYSVKWVVDNLGITRDMLRHYEKKKLLPPNENRNYRDYSEEDIQRIWGIKLLIGIGFTTKEIYELINSPEFDFDVAISRKVEELERKHDENVIYLEFAKSIKFMGRVPNVSKIGSVRFNEFLEFARKTWNFNDDPFTADFMKNTDTLIFKEPQEWSPDETERILKMLVSLDVEEIMQSYARHGYYQVISDMQEFDYDSDIVQRVVRLLHKYMVEYNTEPKLDGKITPQFMAEYVANFFLGGDISKAYEKRYGKEGCLFIAKALTYYGGYDVNDL